MYLQIIIIQSHSQISNNLISEINLKIGDLSHILSTFRGYLNHAMHPNLVNTVNPTLSGVDQITILYEQPGQFE